MRIERISTNQIRCTLSNVDLENRNLNVVELAYGSDNAKALFQEMLSKASYEVGFDADDSPLMIEAVPLSNESIIIYVTKVDDPDELDEMKKELEKKLQTELNEKIVPIIKAIKSIERVIDEFASEQKDRIFTLEERTRDIGKITPSAQDEEEQIVRMFNSGKSIESIAKDLHLGVGRVEFVLKLHQLA